MQTIIYTNTRGESVTFGNSTSFSISKFDPRPPEVEFLTTRSMYQDGETLHDVALGKIPITIEGTIRGASLADMFEKRQRLASIFNPKLKNGLLTYKNDYLTKQIYATRESLIWTDKIANNQQFVLSLISSKPYWTDENLTIGHMSFLMGGLSFPLSLTKRFSSRSFKKVFINTGDFSTPIEIEFYGPATNPVIKNNTTGEFIIVKRELTPGDKLIINTDPDNKRVEIETEDGIKTNVLNWIDLTTTFFQLSIGANEIEYNSNNDSSLSRVIIKYKNRYVGV